MTPRLSLLLVAPLALSLALPAGCQAGRDDARTDMPHFSDADELRDALIDGDLRAARKHAERIATTPVDRDRDPTWRARVEAMQLRAKKMSGSRDIVYVSQSAGSLFAACASCHRERGAARPRPNGEPPPEVDPASGHMMGHLWATERLYDGLIAADDEVWELGARALEDDPLLPREWLRRAAAPEVERLARRVHNLRAFEARSDEQRGRILGTLLAACAGCHARVDDVRARNGEPAIPDQPGVEPGMPMEQGGRVGSEQEPR